MYCLYLIGTILACLLPLKVSYWLAERIADAQTSRRGRDYQIVRANLEVVLGSHREDVDQAAREVFRNFAKYLVDFSRFRYVDRRFIERHVEVEGLQHVEAVLRRGRGMIAFTGHLGNWELAGIVTSLLGYPVMAIAQRHADPRINQYFNRQRRLRGVVSVAPGIGLRRVYAALRANQIVGVLGDLVTSGRGIELPFFGRSVLAPQGAATLSVRERVPIVPEFLVRIGDRRYRLAFEPPIEPAVDGPREEAVRLHAARALAVVEEYIRRYPTQWFMFHPLFERVRAPASSLEVAR